MYERIGEVSKETIRRLQEVCEVSKWKNVRDDEKNYRTSYTAIAIQELLDRWDNWHEAFFLMIPAGGMVHRHIDVDHPWQTFHIPVQTNDDCISYAEDEPFHLEIGGIYSIDRTLEHHSVNRGKTDRIHLLAEVYV